MTRKRRGAPACVTIVAHLPTGFWAQEGGVVLALGSHFMLRPKAA